MEEEQEGSNMEEDVVIVYRHKEAKTKSARIVTFKLDEELLRKIDSCVKQEGLYHRSELIRKALKFYMEVQGCA